ncbi:uncharacterized protein ARMOST_07581 [Armillaria ostoyae]|uniref:Uncharacterized protein n=1 Tax=Armillaria ostoyae TaxID=47428 RepID=A0A284R687_ARMOS|nr:uncharacterized protein ARMOST_07581 [Armillaria ostoyae]
MHMIVRKIGMTTRRKQRTVIDTVKGVNLVDNCETRMDEASTKVSNADQHAS